MAKGYILKNPRVVLVCSCSIPHQEARVLLARPVRRARPRLNSDDAGQTDVLQAWIGTPSDEEVRDLFDVYRGTPSSDPAAGAK